MARALFFHGIESLLLAQFPELVPSMEKTFGSYYNLKAETPEAYPVFESVLREFLFDLLDLGGDDRLLLRIFAFLEEMAGSPDKEVVNLLWIAILEPLVFRRDTVRHAWSYMGVKTRELAREIGRRGGWSENLPAPEGSVGDA